MIDRSDFAEKLLVAVPEARACLEEHLADHGGELLPHLLMSDLEQGTTAVTT